MIKNRLTNKMLMALLLFCTVFHACFDDKVVDFKKEGVEITAYLENNELYNYVMLYNPSIHIFLLASWSVVSYRGVMKDLF